MKKKLVFITVILISIVFSGCVTINNKPSNNKPSYIRVQSDEIIRCFDEKDAEGLKALFCQNSIDYYDIDSEIQNAFDLYEGESVSYKIFSNGGCAGGMQDGIWYDKHYTPEIRYIKTNCGRGYAIGYCTYEVYEKDEGKVGICVIALRDDNGNQLAAIGGFEWE